MGKQKPEPIANKPVVLNRNVRKPKPQPSTKPKVVIAPNKKTKGKPKKAKD